MANGPHLAVPLKVLITSPRNAERFSVRPPFGGYLLSHVFPSDTSHHATDDGAHHGACGTNNGAHCRSSGASCSHADSGADGVNLYFRLR